MFPECAVWVEQTALSSHRKLMGEEIVNKIDTSANSMEAVFRGVRQRYDDEEHQSTTTKLPVSQVFSTVLGTEPCHAHTQTHTHTAPGPPLAHPLCTGPITICQPPTSTCPKHHPEVWAGPGHKLGWGSKAGTQVGQGTCRHT